MSDVIYKQIKSMASQLTPAEMIELAAWLEAAAEEALHGSPQAIKAVESNDPRDPKDRYGSWSDVHATDEDIDQDRRETLGKSSRDDNQ